VYTFLEKISIEDLWDYLSKTTKFSFPPIESINRELLYNLIFAWYGYDLLYEKGFRRLLLQTLSEPELKKLAVEIGVNAEQKVYDLIVGLSVFNWRTNSTIVWKFEEIFKIPLEYLPTKSQRYDSYEVIHPFTPPPQLFSYQKEIVEKIILFIHDPKIKCSLVQLPTGGGKTRTTVEAIVRHCNSNESHLGAPGILWLAHTEELCEQAFDSFKRAWQAGSSYEKLLVRFWGDHKIHIKEILGSITICGYAKLSTLYKREPKSFNDLISHSKILIIDEAHKALAPRTKELLEHIKKNTAIKIIGLTATPGRGAQKKDENRDLATLFEKNLITPTALGDDAFSFLQKSGVISKIKRQSLQSGLSIQLSEKDKEYHDIETDFRPLILKKLAKSNTRNEQIISAVANELNKGNPTLIFSCTVDHARQLAAMISLKGHKAAFIDYKMRSPLRQRVVSDFRSGKIMALCNYGVLSTGFDAPNIKAVVIARPTTSVVLYSQMIGRGLRGSLVGGSGECILIDIRDNFSSFGPVENVYNYFSEFWK